MTIDWGSQIGDWLRRFDGSLLLGGLEDLAPMLPVLFMIVIMTVIGLGAWMSSAAGKKRSEQLQKAAEELSLQYASSISYEQLEQLNQYPVMQRGSNRESTNVILAETDQLRLMIFDHKFVTGSGKNRSTHRQSIAWVASQSLNLPEFKLSPESWVHRVGDFLVKKDIDFDDDPEFSQKFVLSGSDQTSIRDFFDSKRRAALLKINMPTIEATRHGFVFYRPSVRIPPNGVKSLMSEAFSLYQAFAPESLTGSSNSMG